MNQGRGIGDQSEQSTEEKVTELQASIRRLKERQFKMIKAVRAKLDMVDNLVIMQLALKKDINEILDDWMNSASLEEPSKNLQKNQQKTTVQKDNRKGAANNVMPKVASEGKKSMTRKVTFHIGEVNSKDGSKDIGKTSKTEDREPKDNQSDKKSKGDCNRDQKNLKPSMKLPPSEDLKISAKKEEKKPVFVRGRFLHQESQKQETLVPIPLVFPKNTLAACDTYENFVGPLLGSSSHGKLLPFVTSTPICPLIPVSIQRKSEPIHDTHKGALNELKGILKNSRQHTNFDCIPAMTLQKKSMPFRQSSVKPKNSNVAAAALSTGDGTKRIRADKPTKSSPPSEKPKTAVKRKEMSTPDHPVLKKSRASKSLPIKPEHEVTQKGKGAKYIRKQSKATISIIEDKRLYNSSKYQPKLIIQDVLKMSSDTQDLLVRNYLRKNNKENLESVEPSQNEGIHKDKVLLPYEGSVDQINMTYTINNAEDDLPVLKSVVNSTINIQCMTSSDISTTVNQS